jgi:FkbM family methyltransferase
MSINQTSIRPLAWVKRRLVKAGRRPCKVRVGLFKGLTLDLDLQHQTQVLLGLWEQETYSYVRRAARTCEWMVDVGAGKGELCLYFLKNSRAKNIIALEPQDSEIEIIRSNLALNGEQDNRSVTISNKFVGTAEDTQFTPLDALDVDKESRAMAKKARGNFLKEPTPLMPESSLWESI